MNNLEIEATPDGDKDALLDPQAVPIHPSIGTVVAIAGENYALIAGDTVNSSESIRHSSGKKIVFQITPKSALGFSGRWFDIFSFSTHVHSRRITYEYNHKRQMTLEAVSQMITILLYNRRFFPYNISCVYSGLDKNGKGAVYSYDSIGHCDRLPYFALGDGGAALLPALDNWLGSESIYQSGSETCSLPMEQAITIINQCFEQIGKRDEAVINIITGSGIVEHSLASEFI